MKKINFFVISVVIFFTHFSLLFAMPNDEKKALIKKMAEYHSANRVEDSLLCLEKILADNPRDDEALYYRAFIYLEMNKPHWLLQILIQCSIQESAIMRRCIFTDVRSIIWVNMKKR